MRHARARSAPAVWCATASAAAALGAGACKSEEEPAEPDMGVACPRGEICPLTRPRLRALEKAGECLPEDTCPDFREPIELRGGANDVLLLRDGAWLLGGTETQRVDLSDPLAVRAEAATQLLGGVGLERAGDDLYLATGGEVVRLHPETLEETARLSLGARSGTRVAVWEDFAYLAGGRGGVPILDLASGTVPSTCGTEDARDVEADHGLLAIADGAAGLKIGRIPGGEHVICNPVDVTSVETLGEAVAVFFLDEDTVVVGTRPLAGAEDAQGEIALVDVSDPALPVRLGRARFSRPAAFAIDGERAYVLAEACDGGRGAGLHVVGLSSRERPRVRDCCDFPEPTSRPGGRGLAVRDDLVLYAGEPGVLVRGTPGWCPEGGDRDDEDDEDRDRDDGEGDR